MNPFLNAYGIDPARTRGVTLSFGLACAVAMGVACKDHMVNNPMNMRQEQRNAGSECDVQVALSPRTEREMDCAITVKNMSDHDLYLFNRVYRGRTEEGRPDFDRNDFYTYLDDRGRLVLAKAIIPVPAGLHVESKIYPACTKVSPGGIVEDHLVIPIPIELYAPYTKKRPPAQGVRPMVVFRFGYFLGHEGTAAMEIKLPSKEGEVIYFDPFDHNFQKIIEVGPFQPLPIAQ